VKEREREKYTTALSFPLLNVIKVEGSMQCPNKCFREPGHSGDDALSLRLPFWYPCLEGSRVEMAKRSAGQKASEEADMSFLKCWGWERKHPCSRKCIYVPERGHLCPRAYNARHKKPQDWERDTQFLQAVMAG
jgi:hypothetical protein